MTRDDEPVPYETNSPEHRRAIEETNARMRYYRDLFAAQRREERRARRAAKRRD